MPLIDMPLEKLLEYQGVTPSPVDFDEYWEIALKEMNEVDPNILLVESDFCVSFAKCYDLYFTGVKNARIHAKLVIPNNIKDTAPAVLQFHGYSCSCGDWSSKLSYAAAGFVVAALDCRGQGGYSEDTGGVCGTTLNGHIIRGLDDENPHNLLYRNIFLDTAQLAKIIMEMHFVDETKVCAMGGSQGGGLTLACAALEPRINRLAPDFPFLCDYKRVWDMDLACNAYAELKYYFRNFDPQHIRENEIFTKLGYIDVQNLTNRIKGEVLMGVGLADNVCPPSTQFAAYNKIPSIKNTVIYHDYGHEGLPNHGDKVFQFMLKMINE